MTIRSSLTRAVHRIWQRTGPVSTALLPLSWLTGLIIRRKTHRFRSRPELTYCSRVPVAVVGNIYVGGTGKTPVVIALVEALKQRGWTPGVVSRGYGTKIGAEARTGQGLLDTAMFGDEPALIARNTGAPIAVHPTRSKALRALENKYPAVDVIVADDGLQHLGMGRDVEIIVQDQRGIGNGRLLPAGPLREPPCRLMHVDAVITNVMDGSPLEAGHSSTGDVVSESAHGVLHVAMMLQPHHVVHVRTGTRFRWDEWLSDNQDTPVAAVAAIGHPERFFATLRGQGLRLMQTVALPDHAPFSDASFKAITATTVLVTAKDAVKCTDINDDRLFAIEVAPRFSDPHWFDVIHERLLQASIRPRPMADDSAKH